VTANVRSPFLDLTSFTADEAPPVPMRPAPSHRSPFLSMYEMDGQAAESPYDDPAREAFASLTSQLHDEEFDEALDELESHARSLHDDQLAMGASRPEADRVLGQHFAQLVREAEAMVDSMAREFSGRDEVGLADDEVDAFLDSYTPSAPLDPEFEEFFGKLVKKVGNVAKAAAGAAWKGLKAVTIGPLFGQLRTVLRPIIDMVLKRALGALPVAVRPAAQKLAEKLGLVKPAPAAPPAMAAPTAGDPSAAGADAAAVAAAAEPVSDAAAAVQEPAGADAPTAQEELDELIASAFLAQDADELNLAAAQLRQDYAASSPVFAELDDAREQFIGELNGLADGESAEPAIQNFLPAVLPALKLGLRLIGRQRVINFLSPLLAKLIGNLIGPAAAPALSQAIINSGLKLLSLEMSESERAGLAGSAIAATVEDTVGRIAALPGYVLDDHELLEGFTLEAFEQAAAANLPAVFSEATYRRRPHLLEGGLDAGWILLPLRGRKRYKRCSRVFKVRLSPHMSEEVESFEAAPLAEYLEDQLGLPEGAELEADVHLYEALAGTSLADIARGERETIGPGLSDEANRAQLHPLTPQASAVLLGRPGLGRAASGDPRRVAAGQRFYHLAVPGRRPLGAPGRHPHRRPRPRRRLHLNVTLDSVQDQVQVCLYLSEVKAQKLAVQLRRQVNAGLVAANFRKAVVRRLQAMFAGRLQRRLRIVHASMPPGTSPAQAVQNLPRAAAARFAARMQDWLVQAFAECLRGQKDTILAATEDPADGVTFQFTVERPPGLKELGQAMADKSTAAGNLVQAISGGAKPAVRVTVVAGHRCA
jgi:hypothetical protein